VSIYFFVVWVFSSVVEFELALCLFLCGLKGLLNGIWDLGSKWGAFVVAMLLGALVVALMLWCVGGCYVAFGA
jgi:hypothetical protein